jgi:hypothetical protein
MNPALLFSLALLLLPSAGDNERVQFSAGKAAFAVQVAGEVVSYRVMALAVLPEEKLHLEIVAPAPDQSYLLLTPQGEEHSVTSTSWRWTAPAEAGLHELKVVLSGTSDEISLQVFVILPLEEVKNESLNGYRIGSYPTKPFRGLQAYNPPRGFIEVTRENENTQISPHFRLKQFVCKQRGSFPRYVVLRPRLLLKLEMLLQHVNAAGLHANTFNVLSGYRTPTYNAAIGNVMYSRHMWGDGADIFIDEAPRDGMMDDLNRDGQIDYLDAAVLYDLIEDLRGKSFYAPMIGGLGRYGKTAEHGPFVHIDVRGYLASWGT